MSKTIEISRELAERLCPIAFVPNDPDVWRAREELRALLAAPVVERQEPVAWALDVEGYKTVIIDNYQRALSEQEHFHGRGRTAVIRDLYASPPAPVAVRKLEMADVVRAHMEITGCPVMTSNQCHALAVKLNACLDKVKELNQ